MQGILVLALVGLLYCAHAQDPPAEDNSGSITTSETSSSCSNSCNDENSENNGNCIYPCGNTPTLDCIRDYFTNSGQCRPVTPLGEDDIIIRNRQPVHLPFINLTVVTHHGEIKYGGIVAEKFFMNVETKNLVLDLCFNKISLYAGDSEFIIYRRGLEPIKVTDFVNVTYTGCLTTVIPVHRRIMMRSATTSAYITDSHPFFELGPQFSASSDELIAQTYNALLTDIPTAVQEIFLTDAHSYFFGYFETRVCTFGVPYST